uniref:Uncharacterized protein n=1 Tax=Globodera pallida TaxID=36090 RepID=A0A183BSF3_GLOPA
MGNLSERGAQMDKFPLTKFFFWLRPCASVPEAIRAVDELLDSEVAKRIRTENEVTIRFCCPLYANVGTIEQTSFCLDNSLLKCVPPNASSDRRRADVARLCPFDLLFLCRPQSRFRCALFERLRLKAVASGGNSIPYSNFMFTICYAFQVSPSSLLFSNEGIAHSQQTNLFEKKLNKIATTWAPLSIRDDQQRLCLRYANIDLLLKVWHYLRFEHWTDRQLVSLCRAMARLYLDAGAREFRGQITRALQMTFSQLSPSGRIRTVLSQFLTSSLLLSADYCAHRAFDVFQMLSQLDYFEHSLRLLAMQIVLKSIISKGKAERSDLSPAAAPVNLGDVLAHLPAAVSVLSSSAEDEFGKTSEETNGKTLFSLASTVVYLACNRWVDALTADERVLLSTRDESEASLEEALKRIGQTNGQLNRRNINDKMVHTWAQSEHRIREALSNRQRGQLRLSHVKNTANKNNPTCNFVGSSSEDDDDDSS